MLQMQNMNLFNDNVDANCVFVPSIGSGFQRRALEWLAAETPSSFPAKLYRLLEESEQQNFTHIISWMPGGQVVVVHNVKLFCSQVMPRYFKKQTKFASFTRQVCITKLAIILYVLSVLVISTNIRMFSAYL